MISGRGRAIPRATLLVVGLSPLLSLWLHSAGLRSLAVPLDAWFSFQCHQDPRRSAILWDQTVPVCTRCLGIYLGLALGAAVMKPKISGRVARAWIFGASALMLADVAAESFDLHPDWAFVRLGVGLLLSYPFGVVFSRARSS